MTFAGALVQSIGQGCSEVINERGSLASGLEKGLVAHQAQRVLSTMSSHLADIELKSRDKPSIVFLLESAIASLAKGKHTEGILSWMRAVSEDTNQFMDMVCMACY